MRFNDRHRENIIVTREVFRFFVFYFSNLAIFFLFSIVTNVYKMQCTRQVNINCFVRYCFTRIRMVLAFAGFVKIQCIGTRTPTTCRTLILARVQTKLKLFCLLATQHSAIAIHSTRRFECVSNVSMCVYITTIRRVAVAEPHDSTFRSVYSADVGTGLFSNTHLTTVVCRYARVVALRSSPESE